MGCDESQEENPNKPIEAAEVFKELELTKLITPETVFENEFEKNIFMAINVLRAETAVFETVVKAVREGNPLVKNAKHTDKLIKFLEMNERLGEIRWDKAAMDATRDNNVEKIAMQFTEAPLGGNVAAIARLVGMPVPAEEKTIPNYQGAESGMGVIALQLIQDFDRSCDSVLLKPDVTRVGINVKPCAQCFNLIQLLYVQIPMMPPTQESWNQAQQQQMKQQQQEQQWQQQAAAQGQPMQMAPQQQQYMMPPPVVPGQQPSMYPPLAQLDANGQPIQAQVGGMPVQPGMPGQPVTTTQVIPGQGGQPGMTQITTMTPGVNGQPGTTTVTIIQQPNPYAQQGYGYNYPPPKQGMGAGGMMMGMMMMNMMMMDMMMHSCMRRSPGRSRVVVVNRRRREPRHNNNHHNNNQHHGGGGRHGHGGGGHRGGGMHRR